MVCYVLAVGVASLSEPSLAFQAFDFVSGPGYLRFPMSFYYKLYLLIIGLGVHDMFVDF